MGVGVGGQAQVPAPSHHGGGMPWGSQATN